jgi:hypothetical protein
LGPNPVGLNGNISLDPLFLDAAVKNFRLRSVTPVIDAGLNSDAPTYDLDYVARPYDGDGDWR